MSITLDEKTKARISKAVVRAALGDLTKLSKQAYEWLMQQGGFNAHTNWYCFVEDYASGRDNLKADLLNSAAHSYSTHVNTSPGDKYHDARVWNAETMVVILKALGIQPLGMDPKVTYIGR